MSGGKAWKLKSRNKRKSAKTTNHWVPKPASVSKATQTLEVKVEPVRKRVLSYSEALQSNIDPEQFGEVVEVEHKFESLVKQCGSDSDVSNDDGMLDILADLGKVESTSAAPLVKRVALVRELDGDSDVSNDDGMLDILADLGMVDTTAAAPESEGDSVASNCGCDGETRRHAEPLVKQRGVDSDSDVSNDDEMFGLLADLGMVDSTPAPSIVTSMVAEHGSDVESNVSNNSAMLDILSDLGMVESKLTENDADDESDDSDVSNNEGMFDILADLGMVESTSAPAPAKFESLVKQCGSDSDVSNDDGMLDILADLGMVESTSAPAPVKFESLVKQCGSDSDVSNDEGMLDILADLGMVGDGASAPL